jgi:protein O-GlcNAcase/histone acetyltransferase
MVHPPATAIETPCPGGVIEGFYGPPWSDAERRTLLDWMSRFGLTVYLSCPKDDPHHRAAWREPYPRGEAERIASLVADCRKRGIDFIWGVGPGLDLRHADEADVAALLARFAELLRLGCRRFALLLDDIPAALDPADAARFGSLAAAQAHVANRAQAWIAANVPEGTLLLCPTPYCDRMAAAGLGGIGYLDTLGGLLAPTIDVLWTGPEIIAPEITQKSLRCVTALLRRKPVIWDNFFADDYDGQRFFAGPYAGRPRDLHAAVRGVFLNPNNELPLNFVPLHTFSSWLHGNGPWDPRAAFESAVGDWLPAFRLLDAAPNRPAREPVSLADLTLLSDCFYGPYEQGTGAVALLAGARGVMETPPAAWGRAEEEALDAARRLKALGDQLADLADRPLLHALARRLWPLREECTLLLHHADNQRRAARGEPLLPDNDHLPGTFRGGFLAALQKSVPVPWEAHRPITATFTIRPARPEDELAAYRVCLETGADGRDGTAYYRDDPDALPRIFVGPYFAFAPDLAWVVEDDEGVCGYCLGAADSEAFYDCYERQWRPDLTARFPAPTGAPATWTRAQQIHHLYHHPDHLIPGPPGHFPAHVHIDLLPRAQGKGLGTRMMTVALDKLRRRGLPGVHLGVGTVNARAQAFYRKLGFAELCRVGGADGCTYMGLRLDAPPAAAAERFTR